jgi:hypothetical protein
LIGWLVGWVRLKELWVYWKIFVDIGVPSTVAMCDDHLLLRDFVFYKTFIQVCIVTNVAMVTLLGILSLME